MLILSHFDRDKLFKWLCPFDMTQITFFFLLPPPPIFMTSLLCDTSRYPRLIDKSPNPDPESALPSRSPIPFHREGI